MKPTTPSAAQRKRHPFAYIEAKPPAPSASKCAIPAAEVDAWLQTLPPTPLAGDDA